MRFCDSQSKKLAPFCLIAPLPWVRANRWIGGDAYEAAPEGQQRVGILAEAPKLLRKLGADPAEVAASVGVDVRALEPPDAGGA